MLTKCESLSGEELYYNHAFIISSSEENFYHNKELREQHEAGVKHSLGQMVLGLEINEVTHIASWVNTALDMKSLHYGRYEVLDDRILFHMVDGTIIVFSYLTVDLFNQYIQPFTDRVPKEVLVSDEALQQYYLDFRD